MGAPFLAAARDGDLDQLVGMLAADAVFCGDGGGKATAVGQPLYGRDRVAAFVLDLFVQADQLGITVEPVLVNGGPGFITHDPQGKIVSVLSLEVLDGVVQAVRGIVNPDSSSISAPSPTSSVSGQTTTTISPEREDSNVTGPGNKQQGGVQARHGGHQQS